MIQEILGKLFPTEQGLGLDTIHVPMSRHSAPFSITDPKACLSCLKMPSRAYRATCNREILKVDNNATEIIVVNLEQYLTQIEQLKHTSSGEKCDLIMTDSGMGKAKIGFRDLCCYEEKYVEPNPGNAYPQGKRAKARQQMEHSIERLLQGGTTAVNILAYYEKICLFAWRDYDVPDSPVMAKRGDACFNVQVFGSVVSNMTPATTSHHQKAGHNFTFMQIKYPSVYVW